MTKKILILAANPKDTTRLRLDQEVSAVEKGLQRARYREEFMLKSLWAVSSQDLHRAMLDLAEGPNIVHFSGHGEGESGLVFENETGESQTISAESLAGLFELFANRVQCVVLNACYSEVQAKAIAEHIPYVIGMNQAIGDKAALVFAGAFYDALGAGESPKFAYQLACNAIQRLNLPDHLTPVMLAKEGTPEPRKAQDDRVIMAGEGRRFACLIGTNEYEDRAFPPLNHPEANVDAFARLLEDKQIGEFNQVIALKGKKNSEITRAIKNLAKDLNAPDVLLIYVAGYAMLEKEGGARKLYVIAQNTDSGDIPGSTVAVERIRNLLAESKAVQKMLILDCQYGEQTPARPLTDPEAARAELRLTGQGNYLVSSALETGAESGLTTYLLEGLTTGKADLDQSGKITIAEWYTYAQRQMRDRRLPEPVKWAEGVADNWIVARAASAPEQPARTLSASLNRNYKYLSERFRDGSIIPFLGSEMVMPAVPPTDANVPAAMYNEPPLERDLAQKLAEQAELIAEARCRPLTAIAQYYQMRFKDRAYLCQQVKKFFPQDARPGPIHRFLAQQAKPMLVIITSYDTLLEQEFRKQGKPYAVVTHVTYAEDKNTIGKVAVQYSEHPENAEIRSAEDLGIDLETRWVFYKIQGTFDLFTTGEDGREEVDSIMITEEDYVAWLSRLNNQERTIPPRFHRLFQKRPFLFLGYRMCDWNFHTIVHILLRKDENTRKGSYAVCPSLPDFERLYWSSKNVEIIDAQPTAFINGLAEEMNIQV